MALDGGELLELFCPICYGEQCESGFSTLVCGHVFHTACLDRSLKQKKECPSCRCPARPLHNGRREGAAQPRCPCQTGQPVRLYHLQRPRNGPDALTQRGDVNAGSATPGTVDGAALAAAENRAAMLREALEKERKRAADLEAEVSRQQEEVVKASEKAERRMHRLAAMERDHHATTSRLVEDKSRLEAREREQSDEISRMRQALHNTRMDLEKTRASLYEREEAVMRLKREVAMQRARAGGGAALQPRELAELLGERKEDWQLVYSMKVDELRRAMDTATELRAALARSATDADARVAAERLAGAEKVKAVAAERDDAKRELMDLEYKLHEAERRLAEHQHHQPPSGLRAASAGQPRPASTHQGAAPPLQPRTLPPRVPAGVGGPTSALGQPPLRTSSSLPKQQSQFQSQPQQQRPTQLGRSSSLSYSQTRRSQDEHAAGAVSAGGGAQHTLTQQMAPDVGTKRAAEVEQDEEEEEEEEEDDLEALALAALGDSLSEDLQEGSQECSGDAGPGDQARDGQAATSGAGMQAGTRAAPAPAKRDRDPPLGGAVAAAAGVYGAGGSASAGDTEEDDELQYDDTPYDASGGPEPSPPGKRQRQADVSAAAAAQVAFAIKDADMEPVPALPRAFSMAGTAAGARGGVVSGLDAHPALGGAGFVSSFAAKAAPSAGTSFRGPSGGSLVGEGPDGRGGTTRFPLTSSFLHNSIKGGSGGGKGLNQSGRSSAGGGSGKKGQQLPVAPAGRIDAFLRPLGQSSRR